MQANQHIATQIDIQTKSNPKHQQSQWLQMAMSAGTSYPHNQAEQGHMYSSKSSHNINILLSQGLVNTEMSYGTLLNGTSDRPSACALQHTIEHGVTYHSLTTQHDEFDVVHDDTATCEFYPDYSIHDHAKGDCNEYKAQGNDLVPPSHVTNMDDTDQNDVPAGHDVTSEVLINLQEEMAMASLNSSFTREEKACLELEDILQSAGCPLYVYDSVMNWARRNRNRIPSTRVSIINRNSLYRRLSYKLFGEKSTCFQPIEVPTTLPSGRRCCVTVFNIRSQIAMLLSHSTINDWDNYFFNPTDNDPFHLNTFSDWEDGIFDDIQSGIWYDHTQRACITDPANEILVPICLLMELYCLYRGHWHLSQLCFL
jgi:hypothetical protein